MICKACELSKERPLSGAYRFHCLQCCTRLVLTTHPDKMQASAMLAAIARFKGSPGREEVLESVRQTLGKRRSVPRKLLMG